MSSARSFAAAALVWIVAATPRALAQTQESPADAQALVRAPSLIRQVAPRYPRLAPAPSRLVSVELTLTIDERGRVSEAMVAHGASDEFDRAALEAARQFEFEPARRGETPIAAQLDFVVEFVPPESSLQQGPTVLVTGTRASRAASEQVVTREELGARPLRAAADLLRVTPGLVLVQHSGGGKANQYFLRGFDADHGTDVALSFDGVPINLVSHGHGQGYADSNFVIPELVERLEIKKGPYFPELGDFATAGALNLVSRDEARSSIGVGFESSPGHGVPSYRSLLSAGARWGRSKALFAADLGRENGPFEHPNQWDRYRLFSKFTIPLEGDASLKLSFAGYAGTWHGSGQLPARAVDAGLVSRFGSLDPDEGGSSARHQFTLTYRKPLPNDAEFKALVYAARYRLDLFSNFTFYLRDPELGDQIEQTDSRSIVGAKLSYRVPYRWAGIPLATTLGAETRSDDIQAELWDTMRRQRVRSRTSDHVRESMLSAYLNERWSPADFLYFDAGARADFLVFGSESAQQLSPKASATLALVRTDAMKLEGFLNYGHGFHSNDVRGAQATPKVSPLARAVGSELGGRLAWAGRGELSAALFQLDLGSETVWSGDEGTTEASGATTRRGAEVNGHYRFTDWLNADLALTFTSARFRDGSEVPLAPRRTWSGGVTARGALGPGFGRAALRFYGVGERPASDDGVLKAQGFTEVDLALGYRLRWFDLGLDIENLLNGAFRAAQFATTSRLRTDPALGSAIPVGYSCGGGARLAAAPEGAAGRFFGCEDVHFTPANPITLRLMATLFLE
ncbi:MAG: TonB family protein [Polyangiaceae bacterium]